MLLQAGIFYDEPYPWRLWNPEKKHMEKVDFLDGLKQLPEMRGTEWTAPRDKHFGPAFGGTKILCVGRNYRPHVQEMGNEMPAEPLWFSKPPSSTIGHGETVRLPEGFGRIEYEGELALVIGRKAKNLQPSEALDAIAGVTLALDITARELQKKEQTWVRAKGFDTFCPLGPWIVTDLEPDDLAIELRVNDDLRQQGTTADMVFDVVQLVSWISSVMTLLPGDVILTGTPAGVGPLVAGDRVTVTIDGIGSLTNTVIDRG